MDDPDRQRGLYGKYHVEKVNGKPVGECFVLEEHDPNAIPALQTYAETVKKAFPDLSVDIIAMATRWQNGQTEPE